MNIISARERRENIHESILLDPGFVFVVENCGEAKTKKEKKKIATRSTVRDSALRMDGRIEAQGRDRRERTRARCFGATEPGYLRKNARSPCIAPRAAGRRHGRYKWAGRAVVPSGHEEETHGPATRPHWAPDARRTRTRLPAKKTAGERRRNVCAGKRREKRPERERRGK